MNYGYARTSTFDQQYGLEDQIAQLTKAGCDRVYSEQVSATDMEARTEWKALMQGLKAGDVVTIAKIDRAARNIADMVNITKELADKGASIRILDMNIDTTTATGTLMLNIFASVAQFERSDAYPSAYRHRSHLGEGQRLTTRTAHLQRSQAHCPCQG